MAPRWYYFRLHAKLLYDPRYRQLSADQVALLWDLVMLSLESGRTGHVVDLGGNPLSPGALMGLLPQRWEVTGSRQSTVEFMATNLDDLVNGHWVSRSKDGVLYIPMVVDQVNRSAANRRGGMARQHSLNKSPPHTTAERFAERNAGLMSYSFEGEKNGGGAGGVARRGNFCPDPKPSGAEKQGDAVAFEPTPERIRAIWELYPRKVNPDKAEPYVRTSIMELGFQELAKRLRDHIAAWESRYGSDTRFVPTPFRWFSERQWRGNPNHL